ncbi:hypothetical protein L2E82_52414 [Cichorium intybus]|nr:hypothetical protein L2E82_52414 [Cichorium intybus]
MESFLLFSDCWTYDSLKDFRQISPVVQARLKQVYVSVCCVHMAAAVGAYLHIVWNIGGLLTTFATLGCMAWLLAIPPYEEPKRVSLLMAMAFSLGASHGPIFKLAINLDPSILMMSAFMGAAIAFACFAGAATLARRRDFLYLGGLLSSVVLIFSWLDFASKFFGDVSLFQSEIYFELLLFVAYMVVQTQVWIMEIWIEEFGWKGTEEEDEEGDFGEELHSTTNKNAM